MFTQYSLVFIALGIVVVAGLVLLTNKPKWNDYLAFGAVVTGLIIAWVILHPVQTLLVGDAKNIQAKIGAGKPVLLEFQSPF